jgi:hypothetical protein
MTLRGNLITATQRCQWKTKNLNGKQKKEDFGEIQVHTPNSIVIFNALIDRGANINMIYSKWI